MRLWISHAAAHPATARISSNVRVKNLVFRRRFRRQTPKYLTSWKTCKPSCSKRTLLAQMVRLKTYTLTWHQTHRRSFHYKGRCMRWPRSPNKTYLVMKTSSRSTSSWRTRTRWWCSSLKWTWTRIAFRMTRHCIWIIKFHGHPSIRRAIWNYAKHWNIIESIVV